MQWIHPYRRRERADCRDYQENGGEHRPNLASLALL
jgi:hypothetical protein